MGRKIEMVGRRFGRLKVIGETMPVRYVRRGKKDQVVRHFRARCCCPRGTKITVAGYNLRNGVTKSCGCLQIEASFSANFKHGHARRRGLTPEYRAWVHMNDRCYYPSSQRYTAYGGRGIRVCRRWRHSFENFLADMGRRPKGKTLDRKNVDGNYTPQNCRWATDTQQRANKRRL